MQTITWSPALSSTIRGMKLHNERVVRNTSLNHQEKASIQRAFGEEPVTESGDVKVAWDWL